MKENELNKKLVYDGKLVRVWRSEVELEDGTRADREHVERKMGSVSGVLLDGEQNVYLVKEFRSAIAEYNVNLPAGRYDPALESPEEAIVRELREEVGMRPLKIEKLFSAKGGGTYIWPTSFFYCIDPVADPLPGDEDERIEVIKVPFAKLLSEVLKKGTARSGDFQSIIMVAYKLGLLEEKR